QSQRELRLTCIYVTHDQEEALTMSDRIAVMRQGRIVQLGLAEDLYERPADEFVADFLGESNFLEVTVTTVIGGVATACTMAGLEMSLPAGEAGGAGTRLTVAIRPERVRLARAGAASRGADRARGAWDGVIEEVVYVGALRKYQVAVAGQSLLARQQAGAEVASFGEGDRVEVG